MIPPISATHIKQAAQTHRISKACLISVAGYPKWTDLQSPHFKKLYCCFRVSKVKVDKRIELQNRRGQRHMALIE